MTTHLERFKKSNKFTESQLTEFLKKIDPVIFNVQRTTVRFWCTGQKIPRPRRAFKLSKLLGIPLDIFYADYPGANIEEALEIYQPDKCSLIR